MKRMIGGVTVECVKGDIVKQADLDAIVNAANAELMPGGGVAGAIHSAAGPKLAEECRPLAPIYPGEAVITGGHQLPNKHVIHCLGPVYGQDTPEAQLLADCYTSALMLADEYDITSIAFPAISTGAFGYPVAEAAAVSVAAVLSVMRELEHVTFIRFVLFTVQDLDVYYKAVGAMR